MSGPGRFSEPPRSRAAMEEKRRAELGRSLFILFTIMWAAACTRDVDFVVPRPFVGDPFPPYIGPPNPPDAICGPDHVVSYPLDTSPINGVWRGEMEDYVFPSGSSTIFLYATLQMSGAVLGDLMFGDSTAEFPSNPDVGYPVNVRFFVNSSHPEPPEPPYDGFAYTIFQGEFDGATLTFSLDPRQFWRDWCEQQPSLHLLDGNFSCGPVTPQTQHLPAEPDGTSWCFDASESGGPTTDCDKVALCAIQPSATVVSGVCDCFRSGCSVCSSPVTAPLRFDLRLDGDTLSGAIAAMNTSSMPTLAASIGGKRLVLRRQTQ